MIRSVLVTAALVAASLSVPTAAYAAHGGSSSQPFLSVSKECRDKPTARAARRCEKRVERRERRAQHRKYLRQVRRERAERRNAVRRPAPIASCSGPSLSGEYRTADGLVISLAQITGSRYLSFRVSFKNETGQELAPMLADIEVSSVGYTRSQTYNIGTLADSGTTGVTVVSQVYSDFLTTVVVSTEGRENAVFAGCPR